MRAKARLNQGGSIVSFIIVGTLLLVGLGAGIYYVSRDSGQDNQVTEQVTETETDDSEQESRSPIAEGGEITDPDRDSEADSQPDDEVATDREESEPASEPSDEPSESTTPEQIASTGGPNDIDKLPQSGPAEVALSLGSIFVVTFIVASFYRSRRALASEINS